jgi:hypothetical protein
MSADPNRRKTRTIKPIIVSKSGELTEIPEKRNIKESGYSVSN